MSDISQITKDRITKVIASIRGEIEDTKNIGFNMDYAIASVADLTDNLRLDNSGRDCGTIACIAGHSATIAYAERGIYITSLDWDNVFHAANEYLSLNRADARELFYATEYILNNEFKRLNAVTPEHAIRTLELYRDTGIVDWEATEQDN